MEYQTNNTKNIAFEKINDRFSKGTYLGVQITIYMTTGYINGNHLVSQVKTKGGQPKRFDSWKRSKEANEVINIISQNEGINICDLLVEVLDVQNNLKGTYVHPLLISPIANWASPIFAYKISKILNYISFSGLAIPIVKELNKIPNIEFPKIGCIYFVSNGEHIKIGQTYDFPSRLSNLQLANSKLLVTKATINLLNSEEIEEQIHTELAKYRVRGEWFDIDQNIIDMVVSKYNS